MPNNSSAHSGKRTMIIPTIAADPPAQTSGQRHADTGAPSNFDSKRDLAIAAKPSASASQFQPSITSERTASTIARISVRSIEVPAAIVTVRALPFSDPAMRLIVGAVIAALWYGAMRQEEIRAGSVVIALPTLIVFFLLQKQFVAGLTLGATKG